MAAADADARVEDALRLGHAGDAEAAESAWRDAHATFRRAGASWPATSVERAHALGNAASVALDHLEDTAAAREDLEAARAALPEAQAGDADALPGLLRFHLEATAARLGALRGDPPAASAAFEAAGRQLEALRAQGTLSDSHAVWLDEVMRLVRASLDWRLPATPATAPARTRAREQLEAFANSAVEPRRVASHGTQADRRARACGIESPPTLTYALTLGWARMRPFVRLAWQTTRRCPHDHPASHPGRAQRVCS